MANVTITQLPVAGPITGTELVPVVQDGQTRQTTTAAIASSPSQTQTFLTVNQEATLPNSRYVSAQTGIGIVDNGAQSSFVFELNGASASLEAASNGIVAKTGLTTVAARTITASGAGVSVTNGDGVSGNPTVALGGTVGSLANLSSTGLLFTSPGSVNVCTLLGTTDEITVANGTGATGNPTVALASNPVIPGTGGMKLPSGTTAQRNPNINGYMRYNTELAVFEGYVNGSWQTMTVGGVTSVNVSGGTTGLTFSGGPVTSTGVITMAGVLDTTNGGTGLDTYSAGDITYYAAGTALSKLAIGAATTVLTSSGSAPQWTAASSILIGTATNLANGTAGSLPYQTGSSTTTFLNIGTASQVLKVNAGATAPEWVSGAALTKTDDTNVTLTLGGSASSALLAATSITVGWAGQLATGRGGTGLSSYSVGDLLYYATGTALSKLAIGSGLQVLKVNAGGTAPEWVSGAALTSVDDTNVTLTLGGAPTTSLLAATSLTLGWTGQLSVARGGTGAATFTANGVLYGNTTNALQVTAAGTTGDVFVGNTGSAPSWAAATSVAVTSLSFGTTGLTPNSATQGAITVAGTLITSNGGTGLSSYTAGDLLYYAAGTALSKLGIGTSTYVLTSSGTAPQWTDPANITVGTATNAVNTGITDDTTTNATMYPTWVTANTGNLPQKVSSTKMTFNPSSGILTVSGGVCGGAF